MSNYNPYDDEDDDFDSDSILEAQSDVESNFAADTPADGYFSDRTHPQDTFVPNSSVTAQTDSKAREGAADHRRESTPSGQPSRMSTSFSPPTVSRTRRDMPAPNTDPPPDYEAATSNSSFSRAGHTSGSVPRHASHDGEAADMNGIFPSHESEMQWPFGNRGNPFYQGFPFGSAGPPLGPFASWSAGQSRATRSSAYQTQPQQPQNMSDRPVADNAPDEESGLLSGRRGEWSRRKRRCCLGFCRAVCKVTLFLAVLGVLVLLVRSLSGIGNYSNDHNGGHREKSPGGQPSPTLPTTPALPSAPPFGSCTYEHYSRTSTFDFPKLRNFSFNEFMESNHISEGIRGTVLIQAAQKNQDVDLKLSVSYALTRPWMVVRSNYIQTDDAFTLQLPTLQSDYKGDPDKPCMQVFVRMEVRPGTIIQNWELNTGNLGIQVEGNLFEETSNPQQPPALQILETSTFNAVRGSADISYWSSRETIIENIAGSIKGSFALRDLLSLKTQAGSITANVDPKSVDQDRPKPAEYLVSTKAGSIKTYFPTSGEIPSRDYRTRVESYSSSVQGSYILGSLTSIHTEAGSVHVDLLPYFDQDNGSTQLHTDSRAGSTRLNILSPYGHHGKPWTADSHHKTVSTTGSIGVVYPAEWEGRVSCESLSGSVNVKGKGVEITRDERLGPIRHVEAKKGHGAGKVTLQSSSSSIRMQVGEL